jgi:hypothetical protein
MKNNTLLPLNIKVRTPIRSINQLRRITKLIISFREGPDASLILIRLPEFAAPVYNFILYFYIVDDFFLSINL